MQFFFVIDVKFIRDNVQVCRSVEIIWQEVFDRRLLASQRIASLIQCNLLFAQTQHKLLALHSTEHY